jgi:hypothetical protein
VRHLEIKEGEGGGCRGGSSQRGDVVVVAALTPVSSMANFGTGVDKRRWRAVGLCARPNRRRRGVRGEENG